MKRILQFLFLIGTFVFVNSQAVLAQCDEGTPNCANATITCLPFSGTMSDVINNGGAIPGCGGTFSFHNTSWYAIQVTSNTIGIAITTSNCSDNTGVQAGLYTDCDPNSAALGVQCACTLGGINFSASGISPGTYYVMLDGCSGDDCDFNISVTQGTISGGAPSTPDPPIAINPPVTEVCPGQVITFSTNAVAGAVGYNWNFPAGVVPLSVDCNTATVIWGSNGGNVDVTAFNDCGMNTSDPTFIDVPSYTGMEFGEYCFPDEIGWFHQGTNTYYPGGTWTLPLMTAAGCDSTVTLEITENTGGLYVVNEQICPGECTCLIGGQVFCGPTNTNIVTQNAFGCDSTIVVSVSVLSPVVSIDAQAPGQINCENQGNGLLLTANGTQTNAVYSWWTFTGLITTQITDNQVFIGASGRYYVSVTQTGVVGTECGTQPICVAIDSIDITESFNFPEVTTTGTDITCGGSNDGTATVVIDNGGIPPFTFAWDDPALTTDSIATGLGAGTWHVTITSDDGCESIDSVTLVEPTAVVGALDGSTPANCNMGTDGTATVSATGGTSPYSYNIGNGAVANPVFNGLGSGNYTVTITDDNGCTTTVDVDIMQPSAVTLAEGFTEPSCNGGNDGTATITANGGTSPYMYDIGSGQVNTPTFNGLSAGSYVVTVTDDNGCTETINVDVTEPTAVTYTSAIVDADCSGASTGTITITASGGNGPYTYNIGSGAVTNNVFTGLAAGMYTVTVTDDNGCTYDEAIDVSQPAGVMLSEDAVDASCNGGSDGTATITANGGTPPFTYNIGTGVQNTPDFTGLSMGSYTVTVTDDNGCTQTIDVSVGEPTAIALSEVSDNANCEGALDGETTITANGGTPPYSYDIGAGDVTNPNFSGLGAGNYTVTVTDDNGCTETIDLTIGQPTAILLSSAETEVNCNGGSDGQTTITASGGTAPYNYNIGNGMTTTPVLDGLSAGNYTVTVTDDNGCVETINLTVSQPAILTLAASGTDADCFGGNEGTATAIVAGGTAPYSYNIGSGPVASPDFNTLTAGAYAITVTDDNGCTAVASLTIDQPAELEASAITTETFCVGSSDGTVTVTGTGGTPPYNYRIDSGAIVPNPNFSGQTTGAHIVEVIDANGCIAIVNVDIGSPNPISLQASGTDALCFGEGSGTTTVTASGGTGDYTYVWSDGLSQITPTAEFLMAGTYTVTVTDERGCTETIDLAIGQPASALSASTASTDATCGSSNGTITLTPSGGTAPYTFDWSNSTNTQNQNSLAPGNFAYTITDANGCIFDGSETVSTPSGLEATNAIIDASCNGTADGTIDINITGGNMPYTIVWSDVTYNGQTSLTGLASGAYTVTITDDDGCSITSSQTVGEPMPLDLTLTPTLASCGLSDGSINVLITGGTPNGSGSYSFDWSDNSLDNIEDPTGIPQGTYTLIVTDGNGCSITASTDVDVPNSPALNFAQVDVDCNGSSTGSITVDITGGEAPYTYDWSDNAYDGVEDPIAMTAGTYTLIVTDAKNCTDDITVTLTEPTPVQITDFNSLDATCGTANGSISITVQGGTGAYTYDWSDNALDGQEDPNGLVPGNYFVTVLDANGCSATQDISVSTPNGLELVVNSQDASCAGGADGIIDVTINGGVAPFDVVWDNTIAPGVTNATDLPSGVYEVVVTDDTGCTISSNVTIDEPTQIAVVASITDASCLSNDGAINLTVTGGTPDVNGDYTYQWDNGAASVQDPTGLGPNTYNVTVTDANGCTFDFSADVTVPNAPVAAVNSVDAQCNGAADGTAEITLTGGQSPFTYTWSNGLNGPNANTLTAGSYTVTVTDINSCTDIVNIDIAEPAALSVTGTSMEATCGSANGSIDIEVAGGTSPYTYAWSNGAGTSQDPNSLVPGTYVVTITDLQGCELIEDFSVSTPNALEATRIVTDASCNGGDDGAVDVSVTGGTAPYDYLWSDTSTDQDIAGLTAGTYTLSITDADGCVITVGVNIAEPTAIQTSSQSLDATCNLANGSINLSVTGGTPPYQFAWDGGAGNGEDPQNLSSGNYNVTVTDDNGCTVIHSESVNTPNGVVLASMTNDVNCNGGSDGSIDVGISGGVGSVNNFQIQWSDPSIGSTANPTGLAAGTYTITVTDEAGCNFSETLTIDEPPLLEAFGVGPSGPSCNGGSDGSIDLTVAGGVAPYTYIWDNNAGTGEDPFGLPAGTYNVTVTDDNGCTATAQEIVTEPTALELSLNSTDADCFGASDGTLGSTVVGGTQPYSYQWNNNAGTDPNPTGIPAGNYELVVTDANGCSIASSIAIAQPAMIEISITDESNNNGFNVSCSDAADGYVSVNAGGGNPPFSYAWSNGATGTSIDNQTAGTYEVVVTDAKGCSETLAVTLTAPEALAINFQAVPPICYEDGNGFIFVEEVSGGTGPYIYSLDNQPFSSNPSFTNLNGGDYDLQVQDANGCSWTESIQIIEPQELTVDIGDNFEMEYGGDDEVLVPVPNTDPINIADWAWLSGTACDTCYNLTINPLEETIFEFMIEDVNGCIATDQIIVQVRKDRLVYIPNAFTPNGDGVNDRFIVYGGRGVEKIESFLVFDRWGEIVYKVDSDFDPNDPDYGWDGTLKSERLNPGVFVYVAQVRFLDGEVIMYKGDVTLMSGSE